MKIYLVIFIKTKSAESAFVDIDELIRTYGDLGYLVKGRKLYLTDDTMTLNPIYEIAEVPLRGSVEYSGTVDLSTRN